MKLARKHKITLGYILLIVIGYLIGQYPYIPSFEIGFIKHIQPTIDVLDKCVAVTLFLFSLALYFALWDNLPLKIINIFIVWSMMNNLVDELNNKNTYFTTVEQYGLLFAIVTTTYLVWRHRRKLTKKRQTG